MHLVAVANYADDEGVEVSVKAGGTKSQLELFSDDDPDDRIVDCNDVSGTASGGGITTMSGGSVSMSGPSKSLS